MFVFYLCLPHIVSMANGIVRSPSTTVVEKTPSQSSMQELQAERVGTGYILVKACQGEAEITVSVLRY